MFTFFFLLQDILLYFSRNGIRYLHRIGYNNFCTAARIKIFRFCLMVVLLLANFLTSPFTLASFLQIVFTFRNLNLSDKNPFKTCPIVEIIISSHLQMKIAFCLCRLKLFNWSSCWHFILPQAFITPHTPPAIYVYPIRLLFFFYLQPITKGKIVNSVHHLLT